MRWIVVLLVLGVAACDTGSQSAPTGNGGLATSGAGPQPGASVGASTGGGAAGSGTADSAGGAK